MKRNDGGEGVRWEIGRETIGNANRNIKKEVVYCSCRFTICVGKRLAISLSDAQPGRARALSKRGEAFAQRP